MTECELRVVADLGSAFYFRAAGPGGPTWFSAGFFEATGIPQPPSPGWDWTELIHPDDRAGVLERWTQARAAGARLDTELRLTVADGSARWYRLLAEVGPSGASDGGEAVWVGVGLESEQRSDARELTTEFLATASHELRTPLNAIAGWLHMLKLYSRADLPQWQALSAIERNMLAEKALIDDLLDVSRLTRGAMSIVPARVDLTQLVRGCVANAMASAVAKGVDLRVEAPADQVTIIADQRKIEQVVWHLLANSIRCSSHPGTVAIQVGQDHARSWLRVTDSGEGIDARFLPYVFEPFSQQPRHPARTGLGLGLTLVRGLVELHGGSVSAASEGHGHGAVFEVILPRTA